MDEMSGAVDLSECPKSQTMRPCKCQPKCRICGFGKHMAVHGPVNGGGPGSKPFGHEYEPAAAGQEQENERMPLQLAPSCAHDVSEQDVATQADGLCPLCLEADNARLRESLTQIICVCDDNANAQHIEMAVPFIREVAANAIRAAHTQTASQEE